MKLPNTLNTHIQNGSFSDDSNTLNTTFFYELLYIWGLEEVKDIDKKCIVRKAEKNRNEKSLLENVINLLQISHIFQNEPPTTDCVRKITNQSPKTFEQFIMDNKTLNPQKSPIFAASHYFAKNENIFFSVIDVPVCRCKRAK